MSSIVDVLLAVLYPPACPGCARDSHRPGPPRLCGICAGAFLAPNDPCPRCAEPDAPRGCARCRRAPPAFRRAFACGIYGDGALPSDLLVRWKYAGDVSLGRALSGLFADRTAALVPCYDVVVPVPLHPAKLRRRGFNQAGLLARALVHRRPETGRLHPRALRRVAPSGVQARSGRSARAANVRHAFAAMVALADRQVLLVDDVLTSGATASACAQALLSAGASCVDVAVLARTPGRSGG